MARNHKSSRGAAYKFTQLKESLAERGITLTEDDLLKYIPYKTAQNKTNRAEALNLLMLSLKESVTKAMVARMVYLGLARPDWVDAKEWEEKYPLLGEERFICFLAASGMTDVEIAKEMETSVNDVRMILSFERAQKRIDEIRTKDFGKNPKKWFDRIEAILPEAIETAYELMIDPLQKGSTRLAAAESFMDRVLGKAAQKIEIEDSTVKDVLQKIDEIVSSEKKALADKTIELKKEESCAVAEGGDTIETWVAKNPL